MSNYKLTNTQIEAINSIDKCVLKSCPGSGKTFVVANKIKKELETWKLKNSGILALSFTNIACDELKNKLLMINGNTPVGYPHYIATIDSFISQYIFMPFGHIVMECNKKPSIIQEYTHFIHNYAKIIWKKECYSNGCKHEDFYFDSNFKLKSSNIKTSNCSISNNKPCKKFKDFCYKNGFATYNDMNYIALAILNKNKKIATLIAKRFPLVIIDESQDTSLVQMNILEKLIENGLKHVLLVGDPDQAIYEWRDADPSIFLNKYNDENWNKILLNDNFRCSQYICNATNVFSTLPNISKAIGETCDFNFKPQVVKYSNDNKLKVIDYFLNICITHKIKLNKNNVAVLVRGKSGLLGTDYSQVKDLWQSPLSLMLSKASFERDDNSLSAALTLVENALYFLYIDKTLKNEVDNDKIIKKISIEKWGKLKHFVCKNLPSSKLKLNYWKKETSQFIKNLSEKYNLSPIGNDEIKVKTRVKDTGLSDFLEQPISVFYHNKVENDLYLNTTIHSVKGCTFEAVLLILAARGKLTSKMLNSNDVESEAIRTGYVAMTRSRKLLVVAVPDTIKDNSMIRFPKDDWNYCELPK